MPNGTGLSSSSSNTSVPAYPYVPQLLPAIRCLCHDTGWSSMQRSHEPASPAEDHTSGDPTDQTDGGWGQQLNQNGVRLCVPSRCRSSSDVGEESAFSGAVRYISPQSTSTCSYNPKQLSPRKPPKTKKRNKKHKKWKYHFL